MLDKIIKSLELKIPPVVVLIVAGVCMYAVSCFDIYTGGLRIVLASIVWGVAVLIAVAALYNFYQSRTTVNPHKPDHASVLVVNGILKYSRNPMYLSLVLLLIGWGFLLSSVWTVVIVGLFTLYLTYFQIKPEEVILKEKFGKTYEEYCAKVRRWL